MYKKLFTEDKKKSNSGKQLDRSAIEKKKKKLMMNLIKMS